jgi:cytochrome c oxidase subunit II
MINTDRETMKFRHALIAFGSALIASALTAGSAMAQAVSAAAAKPEGPTPQLPNAAIGQPIDGVIGIQPQVTDIGGDALWLHNALLMPIITVITLFVLGLMFWVSVRYRRSANPTPSRTSHNTLIEVLWTLIPALILVVVAVPSIGLLAKQFKPAGKDALVLKAIGNQWNWSYEYPDYGIEFTANMLKEAVGRDAAAKGERVRTAADGPRLLAVDNRVVVPVDREVKVVVTSTDVIHSWAVPAFWAKMDAVPGRLNEMTFKVQKGKEGVYFGQCSELCGARHAFMPIVVEVVSKENFEKWAASKGGKLKGAEPAPAAAAPIAASTAAVPVPATAPNPATASTAAPKN